MLTRTISGVMGLAVVFLAFTWPQFLSTPSGSLNGMPYGLLMAVMLMAGVYLLFFGLTGDWLPKLRKPKRDT